MKVLVVGAGWTGATIANVLHKNNIDVLLVEKDNTIGGHSRSSEINQVIWEPYGAHIFHTSNEKVARFVNSHGMVRPYEHKVITEIRDKNDTFSFLPPQIEELKNYLSGVKLKKRSLICQTSPKVELY